MPHVLFVDDEPCILDGLRRMLFDFDDEFEASFAASGAEALALMEHEVFDVVVSDMRMPVMDGVELLNEVRARQPMAVRVILSGQADQQRILTAVGSTHQFLGKPCVPDDLARTIRQALALRSVLRDEHLKALVSRIQHLPSLPRLYQQLVAAMSDPNVSLAQVGEIVAQDVSMAAKVLQLVNSAFFGFARRIASPEQAAALLGLETLRALVLTMQVFSQFQGRRLPGFTLGEFEDHSVTVGWWSRTVARSLNLSREQQEAALLAGLLHDVGKIILVTELPDAWAALHADREPGCPPDPAAEIAAFGASHSALGAYLLGLWGFADPVLEAVAFHHEPAHSGTTGATPLTAVHVANALAYSELSVQVGLEARWDEAWLATLGVVPSTDAWTALVERRRERE